MPQIKVFKHCHVYLLPNYAFLFRAKLEKLPTPSTSGFPLTAELHSCRILAQ